MFMKLCSYTLVEPTLNDDSVLSNESTGPLCHLPGQQTHIMALKCRHTATQSELHTMPPH